MVKNKNKQIINKILKCNLKLQITKLKPEPYHTWYILTVLYLNCKSRKHILWHCMQVSSGDRAMQLF